MKSPFKFLDPFLPDDFEVFFGRDQDVEALYELIFRSRLMLIYGQSGTGKTSLVQCGLGGRFEDTDWFPFWIRRNENINDSLKECLASPVGVLSLENSLVETIRYLYKNFLRPVYLIFDQFEELFILGDEEEQQQFAEQIKEILDAELPCKILWVMREEYIAHLYHFEQIFPMLFDSRHRVEPMSLANVERVILGSCDKFRIKLSDPEQGIKKIIHNISREKSGIQLPYLQVYLDTLWQEDFQRTYPMAWGGEGIPPLEFTLEEIDTLGNIEDVFEKFLRNQSLQIQERLAQRDPHIPENALKRILDAFVTEEGTKRPISYTRKENEIELELKWQSELGQYPLTQALEDLEKSRILRFEDNRMELAHDSLADLIDRERSTEQRQHNEAKRRIAAAYNEQRKTGEYLSAKQLASLEEILPLLVLEKHLQNFINRSYQDAKEKAQEKEAQQKRELAMAEEKLAVERKSAQRQRIALVIVGIALAIAVALGIISYLAQQKMKRQADQISTQNEELEQKQQVILAKRDSLNAAFEDFLTADSARVALEADDLLLRAEKMKERGYPAAEKELLQQSLDLFESNSANPKLEDRIIKLRKRLNR